MAVDHIAHTEMDNHADTCCFRPNVAIKYLTGVKCSVSTFSKEHEAMEDIEVMMAYMAYNNPEDYCTYILEFNEGLWFRKRMVHLLINPNQVRIRASRFAMTHLIQIERLEYIIESQPLFIPLEMMGTMLFFSKQGNQDPRSMKLALGLR